MTSDVTIGCRAESSGMGAFYVAGRQLWHHLPNASAKVRLCADSLLRYGSRFYIMADFFTLWQACQVYRVLFAQVFDRSRR